MLSDMGRIWRPVNRLQIASHSVMSFLRGGYARRFNG